MITISFVVTALVVGLVVSLIVIIGYYFALKKNSHEPPSGLKNTDICIANGIEEIKIICK